jgi:hypothetical protein
MQRQAWTVESRAGNHIPGAKVVFVPAEYTECFCADGISVMNVFFSVG